MRLLMLVLPALVFKLMMTFVRRNNFGRPFQREISSERFDDINVPRLHLINIGACPD